jgi:hypothetical protein
MDETSITESLIAKRDVATSQSTWHAFMIATTAVCDRHGLPDKDFQMLALLTTISSIQVDIPFSEKRTAERALDG